MCVMSHLVPKEAKLNFIRSIEDLGTLILKNCFIYTDREVVKQVTQILVITFQCSFQIDHLIFSSPEHKVLRVSYCDRPLSVVRRA